MLLGSRYDEPVDCCGALILPRLALVVTDVRDEDRVPDRKALLQAERVCRLRFGPQMLSERAVLIHFCVVASAACHDRTHGRCPQTTDRPADNSSQLYLHLSELFPFDYDLSIRCDIKRKGYKIDVTILKKIRCAQ